MALVLDASATLSWLFDDEFDGVAHSMLVAVSESTAVVPMLWRWEIQNSLIAAEQRERLTSDQRAEMLRDLQALPIAADVRPAAEDLNAEMALARRYELSAYDAAYLELSFRKGFPILTRDAGLVRAAKDLGLLWTP